MASSKRVGFFWGEGQVVMVQCEKNQPLAMVATPFSDTKTSPPSPFSSSLAEEIQTTALIQKLLKDNHMISGEFCVALPMKEMILRSFTIPLVRAEDLPNAVKFEAKKYLPIDIQDLKFVFHTTVFSDENHVKRMRVIFFAVRKESLDRYERIFKQINAQVNYCEPWAVSLVKVLLAKNEIKPTDHVGFLVLEANSGSICFIDQGIPQFVREFTMGSGFSLPAQGSGENLNIKIVNEVGNSFDFYARQFSAEGLQQVLVAGLQVNQELLAALETELKVPLKRFSPVAAMGSVIQNHDMDAVYACGACIRPPIPLLAKFNFFSERAPKAREDLAKIILANKDIAMVAFICAMALAGLWAFLQGQLKVGDRELAALSAKQGTYAGMTVDTIQADVTKSNATMTTYKSIRMKSDVAGILLKIASHVPTGALMRSVSLNYDQPDSNNTHLVIDLQGEVFNADPNAEILAVNQIFSDLKNDPDLASLVKNVNLVSLNLQKEGDHQVTSFSIHCS